MISDDDISDDDVRRWAATFVRWPMGEDGALVGHPSNADLAEAVRGRFVAKGLDELYPVRWTGATDVWSLQGPIPFCAAVLEIVEGKP